MFSRCSNQLRNKIRARYKNIKQIAFNDEDEYEHYYYSDDSSDSY